MRIIKPRTSRSTVILRGEVFFRGLAVQVRVYDLSPEGAQVSPADSFAPGDRVAFSCRLLSHVASTVVWVRGERCGITFDAPVILT